ALTMWLSAILACALSLQRRGGINVKNLLKATIIGAILACVVVAFIPGFQERITSQMGRFDMLPPQYWFSSRLGLAAGGFIVMVQSPLLGVGPGQDKYVIPGVLPEWPYEKHGAHNTYLELGSDIGVAGLAVFLVIFIGAIRGLGEVMRAAETGGAAALAFRPPTKPGGDF